MNSESFCLQRGFRKHSKVGISSAGWLDETNKHLPVLLNTERLIVPKHFGHAEGCVGFVQWGILETDNSKARLREFAAELKRPLAYIEDGFIRSLGIGLSKEPGRSIIMDDLGFYYDASKPSRLETILNSDQKFGWLKTRRARRAISLIVKNKVSKYNDAPDVLPENIAGAKTKRRILIIDQRLGDASISGALAGQREFEAMLKRAFDQEDADIVVKIHPDAMTPGKLSAVSSNLGPYLRNPRLKLIEEKVNPYTLFEAVDEVYTVSSGMGFEAVMAGKPVTCFGVPYYAGWGLTTDMVPFPRRSKKRTVEEVFHVAWIMLSRYADPKTERLCSIEHAVKAMAAERKAKGLTR
ncbi:hypothetical protein [Sinorhizobium meliloti]|uniref:capsular polysaccharide export protein, LipB/KpsS family n=1 Tax=Rhizobium meliloti TaxID=382 RepID=UPI0013E3F1B0|nr:hypothetical protein [Sinorhizobium meliloti]